MMDATKAAMRRCWTPSPYSLEIRPSFRRWLELSILDIAVFLALGIAGIMISQQQPVTTHWFPLANPSPSLSYPYQTQLIPSWAAGLVATLLPLVVFFVSQIWIRSFWDLNNAVFGLIWAVLPSSVLQVTLKVLFGGLRPHFYAVCKPNAAAVAASRASTAAVPPMHTVSVCTGAGDALKNAQMSFPSGHSTTMTAGMLYLTLYLNGKLKLLGGRRQAHPLALVVLAPLPLALAACVMLSLVVADRSHHWYDVACGALLGAAFACAAYRHEYAALWAAEVSHVPLSRAAWVRVREGEACEGMGMCIAKME